MADHGAAWTVSEMASAKAITFGDDKSVRLLRDKAPPRHLCRAAVWGRARNDGAGDPDHSGKRRAV
ncbi:MAG: hypothetical protein ACLRX3_14805 [Subdoligranulum sp.]